MKKIGVLTSGGDSQGMNAAIYATVKYGIEQGLEVIGIRGGYSGLLTGDFVKLEMKDVEGIAHRGGSILGAGRCLEMKTVSGMEKGVAELKKHGIEGLVVIGGDGSFNGARELSVQFGIKTVGIPGTIDNDLAYTEFTLGFDSSVSMVANLVMDLRDTMSSNDRTCVVEVMGNRCGDIALYAGLCCGAEAVLVPEMKYDADKLAELVKHNIDVGKKDNIILVAEGIRSRGVLVKEQEADNVMADLIERIPDINIRSIVLGHLQRGGNATIQDRLLGIRMGAHAVDCLVSGKTNVAIGIKDGKIFDEDIVVALAKTNRLNTELYELASNLAKF